MIRDATRRFVNLGCRLNAYETEAMQELAESQGLGDAAVVNTCAVTAEAVRKSRQAIRRMRRENPHARLIATGCAVQIDPDAFDAMEEVDTVLGNVGKLEPAVWTDIGAGRSQRKIVPDIMETRSRNRIISGFGARSRAHIQIQNGCDHRCTFCVIPFGRGNSRSVVESEILQQVRVLAGQGYNEVVLSGVDITAWGDDLPGRPRLGSLVRSILHNVPDLRRLRVSSVDPVELDEEFIEILAGDHRLMPHLHLSVQAGDDMILKRMKRRHLSGDVIRLCERIRRRRPDVAFGADLIAGFPTETDPMFQNTVRLVEECGLTWLHVFPYSSRAGTPAARMPQVDGSAIRHRAAVLRELGARKVAQLLKSWVGRKGEVLMESPKLGRTAQFALAEFSAGQKEGEIISAQFTSSDGTRVAAVPAAAGTSELPRTH